MRQINGIYTQRYNWKYKKTGHVFQGRYKAIIVDKDSYLLELCRYVVLNPIRAHRGEKPEEWKWSSYGATSGMAQVDPCLTTDWLLSQFSEKKKRAHVLYQRFVLQGIDGKSPWIDLKGQIFLGDKRFIEGVKTCRNTPSHDLSARNRTIHAAHVIHHYTLKEIGDHVRRHYTTVSRIIRNQHRMLQRNGLLPKYSPP